ncbi:Dot/Icm T4SS effector Ceg23 [Legionella maioricensis]|uniref:Dot/Icm secretion system substrate n=1 Tax=Legionella maioricensis TaxID=2896528 RepID=A0A9X2IAF6_9GAMM|nr:hypothetical protein [Legionella maioricensis]MCL9683989.1 hypothetical protein [Legionella maioricensis]MCL9687966.1 hypothetical protein [Legionella maioricensis]
MPKSLSVRIGEALNVSGAFDNCFFHTYATYLLANKLPLPQDLFTFKSIMGAESPASKLQKRFPDQESLSLFAEYTQLHCPDEAPLSPNFIVEKTLVLGFLMREWFATQMAKSAAIANRIQADSLNKFKIYRTSRWEGLDASTLVSSDTAAVLYTANKAFLDYFTVHPKDGILTVEEARFKKYFTDVAEDEDKALEAYWKEEGYQNYCRLIANPSTKLAYNDITPVIERLNQPLTIYNANHRQGVIHTNEGSEDLPRMEVKLNAMAGHYYLLKTDKTTPLLQEYARSLEQYMIDRAVVLRVIGDKDLAAEEQSSLLVGAICPNGHLSKPSFDLLLDKVDHLKEVVDEHHQARLLIEQQRQLIEQERQRQLLEQEQQRKLLEQEQQRKLLEQEQQRKLLEQEQQRQLDKQTIKQPKVSAAEENFNEHLRLLNVKITNLQTRKNIAERNHDTKASERLELARKAAFALHRDLKREGEIYFNQPTPANYRAFKIRCEGLIQTARGVLDEHRGWSEFLINLGLGLATAGIGLVIKGIINLANDRAFFFVHKTDSSKQIDEIEKDINNASPSA